MNLKKLLALALALVMVFALAACGGGDDPAPKDTGSGEEPAAATIKVAALESAYEETYPGMWPGSLRRLHRRDRHRR